MNCRTARQKIRLLVGDDLSQNEIEPVQEHIAECAPCRQHVEELLSSSDVLVAYNAESLSQPQKSVWPNIAEQLPARPASPQRSGWNLPQPLLVAAAAAVIMAAGILPDLLPTARTPVPVGIRVSSPAEAGLPAGEYVRDYPDPSWRSLETLDSAPRYRPRGPVRNVVGF